MKILMVSIPNHHFFQWVDQLKDSGHDVIWFDASDGGTKVERINWVTQIKGWKLKWNFPMRHTFKQYLPKIYAYLQKYNEKNLTAVFENIIQEYQPDIVHSFEMRLAGLPILVVMEKHHSIPFIYSSWGSDLYYYQQLGITKRTVSSFLGRVDYLITDCIRDYNIAVANGYRNTFLGVYPGNGGITIDTAKIKDSNQRDTLIIKGYDDGVGMASKVIEALELVPIALIQNYKIVVYSADASVSNQLKSKEFFKSLKVRVINRGAFISNPELLAIMGQSVLHIGNSISDGMPNALLEAMGMGAFPIQSNPGNVSEEVIENGVNGVLINNPLDTQEIANSIEWAILNPDIRAQAQNFNIHLIQKDCNRITLKKDILSFYEQVFIKASYC
ncbi:glycosyltransferase family 4 protein [Flavobacterium glaciei]|uniref:Glycosyltransferase involved in cell wall biosynthesis n=1 Tax=Flavobacterium glaciei TaxID=386300 RepID=A0A562Q5V5_9FLAO|nr:glycosyltransferase family 4 protein [Flavobacterium glaciei]RDI58334.1 glycosyltransferase involved in cell wall biosynthesis [Flavobacterium glaciei]TWI52119.1 glycosyltransferase involved in cell wall biosynthesis [Flavobacterium glaciei]